MQTIGELAKKMNVSKTAISNKLRDLGIKDEVQKVDGAYYLTDEQAEKVARSIKRRPAAKYTEKKTEKIRDTEEEQRQVIENLLQRLAESNEQIKDLHKLLDQQQQLNMIANKRILELEDKEKQREQEQKQNKGIFARLFHRSKPTEQLQKPQQEETGEGADA